MTSESADAQSDEVRQLQQSVAALQGRLDALMAQQEAVRETTDVQMPPPAHMPPAAQMPSPEFSAPGQPGVQAPVGGSGPVPPQGLPVPPGAQFPPAATVHPGATIPQAATIPPAATVPPPATVPHGAIVPQAATVPPGALLPPGVQIPVGAQLSQPCVPIPPGAPGWAPPPPPPLPGTDSDPQQPHQSYWADNTGIKILGWVGGSLTVLGIVMLFAVAVQQGLLTPWARVGIGLGAGVVLILTGVFLRSRERQTALAVTLVWTGLAVEYLTTVGAVSMMDLIDPVPGHVFSGVIVVVAVAISLQWRSPALAASAFATSAILAPIINDDADLTLFIFEAVIIAGGAACLLLGLSRMPWVVGGSVAAIIMLIATADHHPYSTELIVFLIVTLGTWALFLYRWISNRAPSDPGPFPVRERSYDPVQVEKDYADYNAHMARVKSARADSNVAATSLGVASAMLVIALLNTHSDEIADFGVGGMAGILAVLFVATALSAVRHPQLSRTSLRVVAWISGMAFAGVALFRLLHGDARSVSWIVLAILILATVGADRMKPLLVPSLIGSFFALLAAGPALNPRDLFEWPSYGLLRATASDGYEILPRAWSVVLPAGICVVLLCVATWWAVIRCADSMSEADRNTAIGVTLVSCAIVACYGLLAITMVLSYAAVPTFDGYQAGQIIVTILFTFVAVALLWQGFRRVILRFGGLALAAVAVGKLLLFDTSNLADLPRALTVVGVGVLLLAAAFAYVITLNKITAREGVAATAHAAGVPAAGAPQSGAPQPGPLQPGPPQP